MKKKKFVSLVMVCLMAVACIGPLTPAAASASAQDGSPAVQPEFLISDTEYQALSMLGVNLGIASAVNSAANSETELLATWVQVSFFDLETGTAMRPEQVISASDAERTKVAVLVYETSASRYLLTNYILWSVNVVASQSDCKIESMDVDLTYTDSSLLPQWSESFTAQAYIPNNMFQFNNKSKYAFPDNSEICVGWSYEVSLENYTNHSGVQTGSEWVDIP